MVRTDGWIQVCYSERFSPNPTAALRNSRPLPIDEFSDDDVGRDTVM